jgi:hypothetical protein
MESDFLNFEKHVYFPCLEENCEHEESNSGVIGKLEMQDLTAYEIDEEYFDAACKRIENHVNQLQFDLDKDH